MLLHMVRSSEIENIEVENRKAKIEIEHNEIEKKGKEKEISSSESLNASEKHRRYIWKR